MTENSTDTGGTRKLTQAEKDARNLKRYEKKLKRQVEGSGRWRITYERIQKIKQRQARREEWNRRQNG